MQQEQGLSDDDIDNAMDLLLGIMKDGLIGKFSPESINIALKALNHDSDVALANREGEVRGRNQKIEEKLRKGSRNDGTANLAGKNSGSKVGAQQMPDLGAIERSYSSQDIWERGGEKRQSVQ